MGNNHAGEKIIELSGLPARRVKFMQDLERRYGKSKALTLHGFITMGGIFGQVVIASQTVDDAPHLTKAVQNGDKIFKQHGSRVLSSLCEYIEPDPDKVEPLFKEIVAFMENEDRVVTQLVTNAIELKQEMMKNG